MEYVLEDVMGVVKPIITAAFWGTWEQLFSTQSYADIIDNSGYIIRPQLLSFEDALDEWHEYYGLDTKQATLIQSLFNKKIGSNEIDIEINEDDM